MTYKLDNIEITDTQLDELIAQREANKFEYPLFKRWEDGEIVKFTALTRGTVVIKGSNDNFKVKYTIDIFPPHTNPKWIDVPYNKERDLFHTQAIECWNKSNTHHRNLRFYNAINNRTFSHDGKLNYYVYDNYKAIPLDKVPEWMNEARDTLEK